MSPQWKRQDRTIVSDEKTSYSVRSDSRFEFAIRICPPSRDHEYCTVELAYNTAGHHRSVESREQAIGLIQGLVASPDGQDGSKTEPTPSPKNTALILHPDFEGEISHREIFGDATLADFGTSQRSRYADKPWYQHQEGYKGYLDPLLNSEPFQKAVLYIRPTGIRYQYELWVDVVDEDVVTVSHEFFAQNWDVETDPDLTSLVRTLDGIGANKREPDTIRWVSPDETPFNPDFSYEYLPDHPYEVNGWRFDPEVGPTQWVSRDGRLVVRVNTRARQSG
jgi:hypothetical protein